MINIGVVGYGYWGPNTVRNFNSVDRARGHSRLSGWVDTLAYLCEQPSGLQLQIKARQATREIPNMNIRFEDYMWSRR